MFVEEYGGLELHDVERATEEILLGLEITSSVISDGRIMIKLSYNGKLISDTILNIPDVVAGYAEKDNNASDTGDAILKPQADVEKQLTIDEKFQRERAKFAEISKSLETCYLCINLLVKGALTESEFERCRDDAISKIKSLIYV